MSGSVSVRVVGLIAAFAAASGLSPQLARACTTLEPEVFVIDPSLRAIDTTAPTPFTAIRAEVTRIPSEQCDGDECIGSSCPASGTIMLDFVLPRDDRDDVLGYRLIWLRGTQPVGLVDDLQVIRPVFRPATSTGEGTLGLTIGFDEAATIDGEIALVAFDRAGNESAPSEPVQLAFSGCTISLEDFQCLEPSICSIAQPGRQTQSMFGALGIASAFAGLWLRRRRSAN